MTRLQPACALWTAILNENDEPNRRKRRVHTFVKELVEKQRFQVGVLVVSCSDVAEEDTLKDGRFTKSCQIEGWLMSTRLDDASSTPHARNSSVVQVPPFLLNCMRLIECHLGVLFSRSWHFLS